MSKSNNGTREYLKAYPKAVRKMRRKLGNETFMKYEAEAKKMDGRPAVSVPPMSVCAFLLLQRIKNNQVL
jgi:hypothetical protein